MNLLLAAALLVVCMWNVYRENELNKILEAYDSHNQRLKDFHNERITIYGERIKQLSTFKGVDISKVLDDNRKLRKTIANQGKKRGQR